MDTNSHLPKAMEGISMSFFQNPSILSKLLPSVEVNGTLLERKLGVAPNDGCAKLPVRLNTLKRIMNDEEMKRVFSDDDYEFVPHSKNLFGSAIGNIYLKKNTQTLWLGKVGDATDIYDKNASKPFLNLTEEGKEERRINGCAILEFIANIFYRVFGDCTFETPQMVLSYKASH